MRRTITIDPVTRVEGHGRVFLDLDEQGDVVSAGLVVNELRGFERILVGMEASRMPLITARICGVCPTAHHLAAAKALDSAAGVEIPIAARRLRELLLMGHFVHSHALSLFVLSGPDVILGVKADPAVRNVVGLAREHPEFTRKALRCRTLGQKINEWAGGRGIHPVTAVAGGVTLRPADSQLAVLREWTAELVPLTRELTTQFADLLDAQIRRTPALVAGDSVPAWSLGTLDNGALALYDGQVAATSEDGSARTSFSCSEYDRHLSESVLDWSYMKPVQIRFENSAHTYRVGPLARLNLAERIPTPLAQSEWSAFRQAYGAPAHSTVLQIRARAIELLHAAERAAEIAADPALSGGEMRVPATFRDTRAVGHVEAPRGTLIHDYEIDGAGIVRKANLLVATQQNTAIINESIRQAAASAGVAGDETLLNAVEFAIRCYDPCLSCATHAIGRMPLEIVLRRGGEAIRSVRREG